MTSNKHKLVTLLMLTVVRKLCDQWFVYVQNGGCPGVSVLLILQHRCYITAYELGKGGYWVGQAFPSAESFVVSCLYE